MTPHPPEPEHLAFDTQALPPEERVARYRALYGIGAEIIQTGPAPRVTFRGWRLDRAILYDRRLHDIGHSRAAADLARYGMSHWTATLVLEGRMDFDLGAGEQRIGAGELLFMDTSAPSRNGAHHAHVATLSIAEDRLEELIGPLDGLHGVLIGADNARLYAVFVRSLLETLPMLKARVLPAATAALGGLLRAALDAHGRRDGIAPRSRDSARLGALRATIDARLGDPDFGAEQVIAEAGLSRATLYRLLRPHGGLAAFLLGRRLEHLRRLLSDPRDHRPFGLIARAAGFRDEGQANRTFLARFGIRSGAYRASVQRAEPDDQFRTWQQELR
jgi:AraC-like DNA-binding protein